MNTRSAFTGWLRERGGEWHRVVSAPTWNACWALLIPVRTPGSCEKLVNQGKHPEHRKRPR